MLAILAIIKKENSIQLTAPMIVTMNINGRFFQSFSGPVIATSRKGSATTVRGMKIVISVATTGSKYLYIWYKPRKYQSDKIGSGVTSGLDRPPIAAGRMMATITS